MKYSKIFGLMVFLGLGAMACSPTLTIVANKIFIRANVEKDIKVLKALIAI